MAGRIGLEDGRIGRPCAIITPGHRKWSSHGKSIQPYWYIDNNPSYTWKTSGKLLTGAQRSLSPNQAVSVLDERVKIIGKINADIADWLRVSSVRLRG